MQDVAAVIRRVSQETSEELYTACAAAQICCTSVTGALAAAVATAATSVVEHQLRGHDCDLR